MVMHSHKLLFRSVTDGSLEGRTVGSVLEWEWHSIGAHRMDFVCVCVCVCVCERERERESNKMNIVEGTRFHPSRKNINFICLSLLEDRRSKFYGLLILLFGLLSDIRVLVKLWLFDIVQSIDPLLCNIWFCWLQYVYLKYFIICLKDLDIQTEF